MKIDFTKVARKQLRGLGKAVQIVLIKRINDLGKSGVDERKLQGFKQIFRSRVGDFRIVYRKTINEIVVIQVGHRKEIYRLLKALLK